MPARQGSGITFFGLESRQRDDRVLRVSKVGIRAVFERWHLPARRPDSSAKN